jgi:lipoyl-dependent peroxiredoxin
MPIAERNAHTTWEGTLAAGHGVLRTGSGALDGQEVTWAARTEAPDGRTSPEELCAAAHSSCFSMALAMKLGERQARVERLDVAATVALDEVDGAPTVVSSALQVEALVPGIDAADFDAAVAEAAELCPISRLFAGARISIAARLDAHR